MTYTNLQMEQMITQLKPLLDRSGLIGYAAVKNTRVLRDEIAEYIQAKDTAIMELGEPELDADGNETGRVSLRFDSPHFAEYQERMAGIETAEAEPRIFRVRASEIMGQLTGQEMLDLEWMMEFADADA